jgi:hypothetical protein
MRTPKLRRIIDVTHSEHNLVNEGNQRDPKQSLTSGEQFLSNTDAFYSGGIMRQTRAEFRLGDP